VASIARVEFIFNDLRSFALNQLKLLSDKLHINVRYLNFLFSFSIHHFNEENKETPKYREKKTVPKEKKEEIH